MSEPGPEINPETGADAGAESAPPASPELKNIVEAALLAAGQPLSLDKLLSMFPPESQPSREDMRATLEALAQDYAGRGVELKQIERGYRIQTRDQYAGYLARLAEERAPRYSRALLETLAIIAYRQPVTRGDIEEIRGVSVSTEIIKTLQERDWVRQVGQRDVPGKPALYGTTRAFLEHFNLKSLDELPTLAELRDLEEIGRELNLPLAIAEDAADAEDGGTGVEAPADEPEALEADSIEADAAEQMSSAPDQPAGGEAGEEAAFPDEDARAHSAAGE